MNSRDSSTDALSEATLGALWWRPFFKEGVLSAD